MAECVVLLMYVALKQCDFPRQQMLSEPVETFRQFPRGLKMREDVLERMAKFVEPINGSDCTRWRGSLNNKGYPQFYFDGSPRLGSRVLWELVYGTIPDGLIIRHKCDNPSCLNIQHLELGTHKDNSQDAKERGRYSQRKVTPELVTKILDLRHSGMQLKKIAKELQLSVRSVNTYLPASMKKGNYK